MATVRQPITGKKRKLSKLLAPAALAGYIGYGISNARTIKEGLCTIESPKILRQCKLAFLSDLHFGQYNYKAAEKMLDKLNETEPDALILGGDIIDDNTPEYYIEFIFSQLGKVRTTYGTYFVHGNHDRVKCMEEAELDRILEENDIKCITERYAMLPCNVTLYGRDDYIDEVDHVRTSLRDYEFIDDTFNILVDHVPIDCKLASHLGFDMMLSGHTHDGQMWINKFCFSHCGVREAGNHKIGDMNLIISPGAGCGHWHFRTANHCKYHIVTLIPSSE